MLFCLRCKNQIPKNSLFCPFCGYKIGEPCQKLESFLTCGFSSPKKNKITMFTALKKFSDFSGRASVAEYWKFVFFRYALLFLGVFLGTLFTSKSIADGCFILFGGLFFILAFPNFAVFCRRMHDTGHSGWNWLWSFIPFGAIVLLILLCKDSQPGKNKYGPNL